MSRQEPQDPTSVMGLLASTDLFDVLDESALKAVESALEPVGVASGEVLFRQGDIGDSLYVLIYGRLVIVVQGENGEEEIIGEIGRGEVVGEMAILTGEPRSATVRAIRDSELVKLSREAFERVIASNPLAMTLIARRLVMRLKRARQPYPKIKLSTIAVVSLDRDLPLSDFSGRLAAAFAKVGSTLHMNSRALKKEFGEGAVQSEPGRSKPEIRVWLDKQEVSHKYVVYEADQELTPWTSLCIRQADRIFLVARGDKPPELGKEGEELQRLCSRKGNVRKDLVLVHQDQVQRPAGTKKWMDAVSAAETHYNFRMGSQADFERLVRLLTGDAIGVVLGGGGARGLAHLGVLHALEELGVPIDIIGGTSMGSVIAAQHALGLSHQEKLDLNKRGWVDLDPFKDKTVPILSVLSCKKLDAMIAMMFGDAQIEDLWLKFFCVSANLTQAEMIVHSEGSLAKAVRSSMSIPGVAVPICANGDLIVDGGVLNNLPGDVMRKIFGGNVIVVDVSSQKDLSVDPKMLRPPSPWRILWSRINPFARAIDVPNIMAIMMRTMMIGSLHNTKVAARNADLYIRPPIEEFGLFEWKSMNQIVDAGYQFGLKKIDEWRSGKHTPAVASE